MLMNFWACVEPDSGKAAGLSHPRWPVGRGGVVKSFAVSQAKKQLRIQWPLLHCYFDFCDYSVEP
jgi:hypothetical protein